MRLLVIEDDTTLLESLANRLGEAGFAVETAADGKEGLYFAQEYPIDLAIAGSLRSAITPRWRFSAAGRR